jgi:hypothetical protein
MAKHALDCFNVGASADRQRCRRVTEIVRRDARMTVKFWG